MKYFQEISLLPNPEITPYFIWQKLSQKIHLALVENKTAENTSAVGVGFPEYNAAKFVLGRKLRVFAKNEKTLMEMKCEQWLNRLSDYVHVSRIKPVPEKLDGYACFTHIKPKGSVEKLARRRAKRKGETMQQALVYFENYEEERSRLPYINISSQTNGHHFRLFIEKKKMGHSKTGLFSCYGLSNTTTVPLF